MFFKLKQLRAVWHMCEGRDVFLWLPMGFSKLLLVITKFYTSCSIESRRRLILLLLNCKLGKIDTISERQTLQVKLPQESIS